jgi:hypothetical protein
VIHNADNFFRAMFLLTALFLHSQTVLKVMREPFLNSVDSSVPFESLSFQSAKNFLICVSNSRNHADILLDTFEAVPRAASFFIKTRLFCRIYRSNASDRPDAACACKTIALSFV